MYHNNFPLAHIIQPHTEPGVWRHLDKAALGFMNQFSETIFKSESCNPGLLPDLRKTQTIFVGSDYSGLHSSAQYHTLLFVFTNPENLGPWDNHRILVRGRTGLGSRRFSYKGLNDRKKYDALPSFLEAANLIPGLLVSILIDNRIRTIFERDVEGKNSARSRFFPGWPPPVVERLLRVVHLVSFFLAGLSVTGQDVHWFTDEDEIAANEGRLRQLVDVFAIISSHYLNHNLRHLRIGTTRSDTGRRDVEDFVAIADLVAGAIQEAVKEQGVPSGPFWVPPAHNLPPKAREIMDWFADSTQRLKRLVYVIDENHETGKLRLTGLTFHGLNDLLAIHANSGTNPRH